MLDSILSILIILIVLNESNAWWLTNTCKYKDNPLHNLRKELDSRLINQDIAKNDLYDVIEEWYHYRTSALVIPFGGPTRTGKTLASQIVGNSFFDTDSPAYHSVSMSQMPFGNNIEKASENIRKSIINGIKQCKKLTVFVFDEIQSVDSEIFQSLNDILDERGYATIDPISNERLNTSNSIFIFITDITEGFLDIITKNQLIFQDQMDLKKKIDEKFRVNNIIVPFTRHMKKPVVFYPFYSSDLKDVMKVDWNNEVLKQKKYSNITISDKIIDYIVSPNNRIVSYNKFKVEGKSLYIASDSFADVKNVIKKIKSLSSDLTGLIPSQGNNFIEFGKTLKYEIIEKSKINAEIEVKYNVNSKTIHKKYLYESTIESFLNGERNSFQLINTSN